jgi:hypothetical protein
VFVLFPLTVLSSLIPFVLYDMVIGNGIEDNTPAIQYVALDVNDEWYYGRHERVDDMYDATNSKYHIVKAIIL